MLKRVPSLSEQAKNHIKERILNEEFSQGRIPSETELAELLGVSRTTIREALSRLELEGVVYRRQGAGTFVNTAFLQIKTRLEEMWSYSAVLEAHGYAPSTRILALETARATAEDIADLAVAAGSDLLTVRKLFLEDDQPVILTVNRIPQALIVEPYDEIAFHEPIYAFLWDHCRQRLAYYVSDIIPIIASPTLAADLGLTAGAPLISFSETGYNEDNQPILKATSYFRDDLLRLRLIRRKG
jgi:GntR family transcriptional regulator